MAQKIRTWVRYDIFGKHTDDIVKSVRIPKTGRWKEIPKGLKGPIRTLGGGGETREFGEVALASPSTGAEPSCLQGAPTTFYSYVPPQIGDTIYRDIDKQEILTGNNNWYKDTGTDQSLRIDVGVVVETYTCV